MIVWLSIPESEFKRFISEGTLTYTKNHKDGFANSDDIFKHAYMYMIEQMNRHGLFNNDNNKSPIWCWYQIEGNKDYTNIDKYFYEHTIGDYALVVLNVPEELVLLSDYDIWHYCLNCWCVATDDKDYDEYASFIDEHNIRNQKLIDEEYRNENQYRKEAYRMMIQSWTKIFDIYREDNGYLFGKNKDKTIQGCCWSLDKENIIDIIHYKITKNRY